MNLDTLEYSKYIQNYDQFLIHVKLELTKSFKLLSHEGMKRGTVHGTSHATKQGIYVHTRQPILRCNFVSNAFSLAIQLFLCFAVCNQPISVRVSCDVPRIIARNLISRGRPMRRNRGRNRGWNKGRPMGRPTFHPIMWKELKTTQCVE